MLQSTKTTDQATLRSSPFYVLKLHVRYRRSRNAYVTLCIKNHNSFLMGSVTHMIYYGCTILWVFQYRVLCYQCFALCSFWPFSYFFHMNYISLCMWSGVNTCNIDYSFSSYCIRCILIERVNRTRQMSLMWLSIRLQVC